MHVINFQFEYKAPLYFQLAFIFSNTDQVTENWRTVLTDYWFSLYILDQCKRFLIILKT